MRRLFQRRARLGLFMLIAVLGLSLVAAACGDDDDDDDDGDASPVATSTRAPAATGTTAPAATGTTAPAAGGGETTFDIVMKDNTFDPAEIVVAAGEEITVNLVNDGQAIHDMRIAGVDGDYDTDDDFVSDPDLMRGGEEGTLVFTFDEAGQYNFRCDFHPTEMTGTIEVE